MTADLTPGEREIVAKGHCEYCMDYIEPATRERHRGLCAFAQALATQRDDAPRSTRRG